MLIGDASFGTFLLGFFSLLRVHNRILSLPHLIRQSARQLFCPFMVNQQKGECEKKPFHFHELILTLAISPILSIFFYLMILKLFMTSREKGRKREGDLGKEMATICIQRKNFDKLLGCKREIIVT